METTTLARLAGTPPEEPPWEPGPEPLTTLDELLAGTLAGWRRGTPAGLHCTTYEADVTAARLSRCGHCNFPGLAYHPYTRPAGGYRAVPVCPLCSHAQEF